MADIEKVEADDPNRCQATTSKGQCLNKAHEHSNFCLAHGGNKGAEAAEAASVRNYQLAKFQAKLDRHAASPSIKSLRDEVGILRMLMEEQLNRCKDSHDLVVQSASISDLVMKIDKLVTSCHKLEGSLGQLLDKQVILQFANETITLIANVLKGEDNKIREIADGITGIIGRLE